jgi:hypothetical protein
VEVLSERDHSSQKTEDFSITLETPVLAATLPTKAGISMGCLRHELLQSGVTPA